MNRVNDGYTALKAMCAGYDAKEIAAHLIDDGLWKEKSLTTGEGIVNRCLNRNRSEFFKFSEIIAITRFTGNYDALDFFCDEVGASRSHPLDLNEQIQQLKDQIGEATTMLSVAGHRLQQLQLSPDAQKVTTLRPPQKAVRFSKYPAREF